ncbi:MAG: hypothetical protein LBJ00_12060 [Planctomycetaceae bacterium]|jgi:hypothetical protein|nr:hypothetical protein [Planctomycetaceae bacterium]
MKFIFLRQDYRIARTQQNPVYPAYPAILQILSKKIKTEFHSAMSIQAIGLALEQPFHVVAFA